MTFLWVCSRGPLGLSQLAGPEEGEKGGYMVAVTPLDISFQRLEDIAVSPGQAVPVLDLRWWSWNPWG